MKKLKNKYLGININIFYNLEKYMLFLKKIHAKSFSFLFSKKLNKFINKNFINKFIYLCNKYNYLENQILPHSNFCINLGHFNNKILFKNIFFFIKEVNYCFDLGLKYINFHPGYHLNIISDKKCLNRIGNSLNYVIRKTKKIILLIENMSGSGSSVCSSFEQISYLINLIEDKSRIGVCFDICHAYSYGYDLSNINFYKYFFFYFHKTIGLNYLKAVHLSNSINVCKSRKDRHCSLKKGNLSEDIFFLIMNNDYFNNIPIILETRNMFLWKKEINWLYSLQK